jgi:CHAT domain-containing protein/cytochrome c-type biogenesis protein CcmH/NrfG
VSLGEGHLSREQIDSLIEPQPGGTEPSARPVLSDEARRHLDACEACQRLVRMHEEIDRRLSRLKDEGPVGPGKDCHPLRAWWELAAGTLPLERAEKLLEHATHCGHCGPLLRQACEDFAAEPTREEELALTRLEGMNRHWESSFARTLAGQQGRTSRQQSEIAHIVLPAARQKSTSSRWLYAAAVVALVALIGTWWYLRRPNDPARLLAEAYAEQRTLELRIPAAPYGPLRMERGSERSRLSRPLALLDAEALIARKLAEQPNNPYWLAEQGRAELLDWQYAAAIKSFTQALAVKPDAPDLERDLATAYFQRAESEGRAIDYGTAIQLLSHALGKAPNDPIALFNRAIADEKMFLYNDAIQDWERYLKADPKGDWAAEAQRHLANLREKIKAHENSGAVAKRDPKAAATLLRARADSEVLASADVQDSVDEEYLSIAVREWLPALYSPAGSGWRTNADVQKALLTLSEVLRAHHHDRWLADVLSSPPSQPFVDGLRVLGDAVKTNAEGDPADGESLSKKAERGFRAAGNIAGSVRAGLEAVYALQRAPKVNQCIRSAQALEAKLKGRGYTWNEYQLQLEKAACWMLIGDFGKAGQSLQHSRGISTLANYGTLDLRSLGFASGLDLSVGNEGGTWEKARDGLSSYWGGSYPPVRAYQFYSDLAQTAEDTSEWQMAAYLWREAVLYVPPAQYPLSRALAQFKLATALGAAGLGAEAAAEFDRASRFFAALELTSATRAYETDGEISLAALEAERGDVNQALARLDRARPAISGVGSYNLPLHFYQTLGEIYMSRGETQQAKSALVAAANIAEQGLLSLRSYHERLTWDVETGKTYRLLVQLYYRQLKDATRAFEIWEWYRSAAVRGNFSRTARHMQGGHASRAIGAPVASNQSSLQIPTLAELGKILGNSPDEIVISYAQLRDGVIIWHFDNSGLDSAWVPVPSEELERLAKRFRDECANPESNRESLQRDSRSLYNLLIAPAPRRLTAGRTLIIEPDGAIWHVPFQALMDGPNRYLGTQHAIVTSLGLGYLGRHFEDSSSFTSRQRALVISDPSLPADLAASFPPFADAGREAEAITSRFIDSELLGGKSATREAVQRELGRAEIFHFVGHTISRSGRVGLLLASGQGNDDVEVLDAANLQRSQVRRCKLVVLSACSTGMGERAPADPESLVRAFLQAGVPNVIASRWNVDSGATTEFMDLFYADLLSGQPVFQALQSASNELRKRSATSHPYYWSAFSEFGLT